MLQVFNVAKTYSVTIASYSKCILQLLKAADEQEELHDATSSVVCMAVPVWFKHLLASHLCARVMV